MLLEEEMEVFKWILTGLYIIICIALVVIVLMQEGKSSGLSGAISGGASNTFWSKNKGRSFEGTLSKLTVLLAALFIIISLVLNLGFWNN